MLYKVYRYHHWDAVLHEFGLAPVEVIHSTFVPTSTDSESGGTGESFEHKRFKLFIADNPSILGLPFSLAPGEIEFTFGSADAIDILFKNQAEWVGVEVKSKRSEILDIQRGLFQCVKYLALIDATQRAQVKSRIFNSLNSPTSGGRSRCIDINNEL